MIVNRSENIIYCLATTTVRYLHHHSPQDSAFHVSSCVCVFSAGAGTCHMTENEIFGSGMIWMEFIANINKLRMVDRVGVCNVTGQIIIYEICQIVNR